eukprot:scaffold256432_cov30-Tisochrysis_lutea.AAC.2
MALGLGACIRLGDPDEEGAAAHYNEAVGGEGKCRGGFRVVVRGKQARGQEERCKYLLRGGLGGH